MITLTHAVPAILRSSALDLKAAHGAFKAAEYLRSKGVGIQAARAVLLYGPTPNGPQFKSNNGLVLVPTHR